MCKYARVQQRARTKRARSKWQASANVPSLLPCGIKSAGETCPMLIQTQQLVSGSFCGRLKIMCRLTTHPPTHPPASVKRSYRRVIKSSRFLRVVFSIPSNRAFGKYSANVSNIQSLATENFYEYIFIRQIFIVDALIKFEVNLKTCTNVSRISDEKLPDCSNRCALVKQRIVEHSGWYHLEA